MDECGVVFKNDNLINLGPGCATTSIFHRTIESHDTITVPAMDGQHYRTLQSTRYPILHS